MHACIYVFVQTHVCSFVHQHALTIVIMQARVKQDPILFFASSQTSAAVYVLPQEY